MRLTLRQLQIFRAVVRCGTTGAAAAAVSLSQSATSAALNELERTLNASLFDRVGKRLQLNDAGRTLLPAALALLKSADEAEALFDGRGPGDAAAFNIFASTTIGNYILPRLFAAYWKEPSGANVTLQIGNSSDVVAAVRGFETDLGFIEGPCHSSDVTVVPWRLDEMKIVAAPSHPLARARRDRLNPGQLTAALWLLREPGSGTREAMDQALLPHLPNLHSTMTLASSEAIKHAVAAGLGLGCLSSAVVEDFVSTRRLIVLRTRLPRLMRRLSIIHHRHKVLSGALRRFLVHARAFDV